MLGKRVVAKLAYAVMTEVKGSQPNHAVYSLSLNLTDLVVMPETGGDHMIDHHNL